MTIEQVVLPADELHCRPAVDADASGTLAMLTDPDIEQWNPAPAVTNISTARDWLRRSMRWEGHATFTIADQDDALIGNVSLFQIDEEQATAEIGYRVAPWARGRGVAATAVGAVSRWAFETLALERIQLFHAVANPASCRVAEKNAYQLEGLLRSGWVYGDGRRYDLHLHARLSTDRV